MVSAPTASRTIRSRRSTGLACRPSRIRSRPCQHRHRSRRHRPPPPRPPPRIRTPRPPPPTRTPRPPPLTRTLRPPQSRKRPARSQIRPRRSSRRRRQQPKRQGRSLRPIGRSGCCRGSSNRSPEDWPSHPRQAVRRPPFQRRGCHQRLVVWPSRSSASVGYCSSSPAVVATDTRLDGIRKRRVPAGPGPGCRLCCPDRSADRGSTERWQIAADTSRRRQWPSWRAARDSGALRSVSVGTERRPAVRHDRHDQSTNQPG